MSNKQWDDLSSQDLTSEEVQDLNIDDILNEIKSDWLQEDAAEQVQQEEPQPVEENVEELTKEDEPKKATAWQKVFLVYLHDLVYLLSALIVVFLLLFRIVIVSGTSMNNTLYDGDYLLLLGNTFYHNPSYGDVIVASKESFDNGAPIVKRVIATEGQWVRIDAETGIVYVGDTEDTMQPLEEIYIKDPTMQDGDMGDAPIRVDEGCLFVMGDNRMNSKDSRYTEIGLVDKREVLGKVFFLFLPGSNKGTEAPDFGRVGVVQ